jgi:phosphoribosylanthranilate isomerase
VLVQLYGFTDPADMAAVAPFAPDLVGVVLDEGFGTWDHVDRTTARAIAREVPPGTRLVGLSQHHRVDDICATVAAVEPDVAHLVRVAGVLDPDEVARLRQRLDIPLMLTVPVDGPDALSLARRYAPVADYLLLDTVDPTTGVPGATGQVHDWALSAALVAGVGVPVILAGGLGPENVAEAIAAVDPAGVDSETRTSRDDDRRRKDVDRVARFIAAARTAG